MKVVGEADVESILESSPSKILEKAKMILVYIRNFMINIIKINIRLLPISFVI